MFVNIDLVSTAKLRADGSLSLTVHGTRDNTGGVEHYTLHGDEAKAAVKILHKAK